MSNRLAAILVVVLFARTVVVAEEAAPLRVHMISGSKEYESEKSLKAFAARLEKEFRIECTASWAKDGATELDNLEALKRADVLLVFARRLKLGDEQMAVVRGHWRAGKPVVGIRTAGHAFQQADNEVFDKQVLGGHYAGHYGNETVTVGNTPAGVKHPVLAGVGAFESKKLYKAGELAKSTVVLQTGRIEQGTHPVTIVHEYEGGRTFFTSLGVPEDFENAEFRRLLTNAILWTARRDRKTLAR